MEPAFENYYPQNYESAERGVFVGLDPLGDLDAKTQRTLDALDQARRAEIKGGGAHSPGLLALIVTPEGLKFVGRARSLRASATCGGFSLSTAPPISLP